MAGLRWMAVVLTVFLSAGDSLAAVDQNWLTSVIEGIKKEYALDGAFSLAVNVPENQDINNLQQVFQSDPADGVKQKVSEGQVYQGTRVVAAAQSVSRVLENIQTLMTSSQGNVLVIYSEESPCCPTNEDDVADKVNDVVQKWSGYALVFSKVPDVPDADASQLAETFKQLAISKLGLDNIFRCYEPGGDPFQCTSCSSGGDVTPSCVANDASSNEGQGEDEDAITVPPTGTDTGTEIAPGGEMGGGIGPGIDTGKEIAPGGEMGGGIGPGIDTGKEIAPGGEMGGGIGPGIDTGTEIAPGGEMGGGIGPGIDTGINEGIGGGRGTREGKVRKQSKHRKGGRRKKGGKLRKQSKRRKGGKRKKGGKVRKQSKRRKGGKRKKGGKLRKQSKRRKGGKRKKGGKLRKQSKRRKGGKRKKGGKVRKQSKRRKGGRRKKGGKVRKQSKRRKGGRRKKGGKVRKQSKRRGGGRGGRGRGRRE
ncbi:uncharacterized protein [Cebidichthys violaceus]|uniref:uncharacterized protein n=1 Tax=Cebidichthys violaceus TaxID=271503 RepID=UPI0035C9B326